MPHTKAEAADSADGRVLRAQALREQRYQQILVAAAHVLSSRGYWDATLKDLLDEADIARGTFYAHFPGVRAAFDTLLEQFVDELAATIQRVDVGSDIAPGIQLRANIERVVNLCAENAAVASFFLNYHPGENEELNAHVERFYARLRSLVNSSLTSGETMGLIRPGDREFRITFILGIIKEALSTYIVADDAARLASHTELATQLLDFALQGLSASADLLTS